jgi:hypothetical protein
MQVVIDSDGLCFGGPGRVGWDADHFTTPCKDAEEKKKFAERDQYFQVCACVWDAVGWGGWV